MLCILCSFLDSYLISFLVGVVPQRCIHSAGLYINCFQFYSKANVSSSNNIKKRL